MDRRQSGFIFFALIIFILYAFGVELFEKAEKVWQTNQLKNIDMITCEFDTLDNFCNDMNIKNVGQYE